MTIPKEYLSIQSTKNIFANDFLEYDVYIMKIMDLLSDFFLVGGMTLMFTFIVKLLRTKKGLPHNLQTIIFALCFLFLLYYYAQFNDIFYVSVFAFCFGAGMGFLLGPLMYAYILSITLPAKQVKKQLLKHSIPYFLNFTFLVLPYCLNLLNPSIFPKYGEQLSGFTNYIIIIENFYLLYFLWLSIRMVRSNREILKDQFSNLETHDLSWCINFIKGLSILITIETGIKIYDLFFPTPEMTIFNISMTYAIVSFFAYFAYKGIHQEKVELPNFIAENARANEQLNTSSLILDSTDESQPSEMRYFNNVTGAEIEELKSNLYRLLEENKIYTDENLNLDDLANQLNLSDQKLSEFLNHILNTTFYDLINSYRVDAVKERIIKPDTVNLTLLAIGLESGFKSKSSFNRVFKNKTGMSPSEYKRNFFKE